jgi:CheY-like chemotaxis protein
MTILVADDYDINRKLLRALLKTEDYEVIEADDGAVALDLLKNATGPMVGLIDWEMPGLEGIEVCRQARQLAGTPPLFLILVTVRDHKTDVVAGLQAGAKMVELQQSLTENVAELTEALVRVKQLSGLLPICGYCKKIRDDKNYWQQVEAYVGRHSEAKFSHSICPDCYESIVKPEMIRLGVKP